MNTKSVLQVFAGKLKEKLIEAYTARREIEKLTIQRGVLTDEVLRLTKMCDELMDDLEAHHAHE